MLATMQDRTLNLERTRVLESLVSECLQRIKIVCIACFVQIQELIRMMKGIHKKGWTWVNTGAEMLCMMLNKNGDAFIEELNIVA